MLTCNRQGYACIFSAYADTPPLLPQLHVLRSSTGKVVKVKQSVCAVWENVATRLGFTPGLIDIIRKESEGPETAFDNMMKRWLKGTEGTCTPIAWRTLLAVFQDIDHGVLASDLENILPEVSLPV